MPVGHAPPIETPPKSTTFSRADLASARVLAQVDRKFILLKLASAVSGDALVLVDQHAASERIRVERFLTELCVPAPQTLKIAQLRPQIKVSLSKREAGMLWDEQAGVKEALEQWGIEFGSRDEGVHEGGEGGEQAVHECVSVRSVPEVVSEKLLAPRELEDLIKGFLTEWESGSILAPTQSQPPKSDERVGEDGQDEFKWQKMMRRCPRGLIELVNSRACRGAIMFNDLLSVTQCERLVGQLAKTAFPFICAHGRPSIVPLGSVEGSGGQIIRQRGGTRRVNWERLKGKY